MKTFIKTISLALSAAIIVPALYAAGPKDNKGGKGGQQRMTPEMRKQMLEKFDKDGDGQLSETERQAAKDAQKAAILKRKQEILEKYDSDGDGKLSEDEKNAMIEAKKAEILEKYDADGNGELSEAEREQARADRAASGQQPPQGKRKGPGKKKKGPPPSN